MNASIKCRYFNKWSVFPIFKVVLGKNTYFFHIKLVVNTLYNLNFQYLKKIEKFLHAVNYTNSFANYF